MARMKFMNTEIDNLTMQETLRAIDQLIQEKKSAYVVTPNVDHIVQLETNKELQAVYKNASLILTDGKPLLWIANWYGTPIKEKISGSDLFPLLCEMAAEKGYKMFFLGAAEGVAAKAAENLMNRFYRICGALDRLLILENTKETVNTAYTQDLDSRTQKAINRLKADFEKYGLTLVFYGYLPTITDKPGNNEKIHTYFY